MNQIKIGKFISERRKEKNITQIELAEKLGITDRAISKWENGICMPDSGIIPLLCKILNITINDLFSGEVVDMKNNEKRLETNLLEMVKLKEQKDKQLLSLEIFIGVLVSIIVITCVFVASYVEMNDIYRVLIIISGFIPFIIGVTYCLKIEQIAGYYECSKCHHKYVPTFKSVLWAMHINRTRYMKCPNCNKRSWNKKVLSK
ncbi:MAG: helix-turn-helix transcriptional regulator [Bacilli bacterium]|nr:helix-turn-helix transcriptional regulator [Bacilli bacterium]